MEQQAAATTTASSTPVSEPVQVRGEALKCDQCDFVSKSMRGLKTHISRAHKEPEYHGSVEEASGRFSISITLSSNISAVATK